MKKIIIIHLALEEPINWSDGTRGQFVLSFSKIFSKPLQKSALSNPSEECGEEKDDISRNISKQQAQKINCTLEES